MREDAQRMHTKTRSIQRFGVRLSDNQYAHLIESIQSQKATFVKSQSLRVKLWRVTLSDGSTAVAVYDKKRKTICTLLPDGPVG